METGKGKPTIAFVMKTLNNPFFIDMQKGARYAADSLGVNLMIRAAEREVDAEKQLQIMENLIQRKVAAICITPSGSKEIVPGIVKANRAGIPVLVVDTRIDEQTLKESGGYIGTFIGSDNVEGGRIAAEYIVGKLNHHGKIAVLEGIPGHETGDARLKGFREIIDAAPEVEIIASQTANWERDQGFNVFQNMLQSNPDIEALFACNDMMALGAVEAIAAAGKTGQIIVVGFDAVSDGRIAIQGGRMAGSVAQHPYEMGFVAIEKAMEVINGKVIPGDIPVTIELITREKL
ncbi:MAG: substrate-binding domain-containing protein [Candidatus Marinimicrobia bacterium]|nr:substrate-binding domain-containing protein [Candidatus Neomarinimicrobiota bacterium]